MQIDLLGVAAVAGIERENRPVIGSAVNTSSTGTAAVPQDTASLSSGTQSVPSLAAQALSSADARLARVAALRQAVANVEYTLDPALIADAMISQGA